MYSENRFSETSKVRNADGVVRFFNPFSEFTLTRLFWMELAKIFELFGLNFGNFCRRNRGEMIDKTLRDRRTRLRLITLH